jgi:methionyl-tRNA formyltransferase
LPGILAGIAQPRAQDDSQATFTSLFTKSNGQMDLCKSARQLEREVRAYAVWPKSRLDYSGTHLVITKARVAQHETDGDFVIACQSGYLEIEQLVAPSGKTMTGADFRRGYLRS